MANRLVTGRVYPDLFAEGFDLFSTQHTDLAVPIAAVGVARDAPFRGEHGAGHRGLDSAAPGACADGQNFTHKMLSSDAVHAAGGGHAPVLKMMLPGFGPDGLPDGRPQPGVVGPAAQQSTQVTPGLAGKAGTQKALTRQPYLLQEAQNLPCTAAMKPMLPFQPGTV